MTSKKYVFLAAAGALLATFGTIWAQTDTSDKKDIVLTYYKVTGEPLDVSAAAEQSDAVRHASNFDRPDAIKAEAARLQDQMAATSAAREFTMRVNDSISEYDHDRGEFSILLFRPGYYVPIQAFGQEYKIVFANAENARPIRMPKDAARLFDAQLNKIGRAVTNAIQFRVIGKGDPAGAVTGDGVIRAEIVSSQLLDRDGRVVFTPTVSAAPASANGGAATLDLAHADVAGFRVGVKVKDLAASLDRLFGPVSRASAGRDNKLFAGALEVNQMGCINLPDGRHRPKSGAVCVTAFYDSDEIVRSIRIERVFLWFDAEIFRKQLVAKYGPVASAVNGGSDFSLGWGPQVDTALVYQRSGPHNALTAHYMTNDDFMSRGLNSLPQIRIVLSLVDAQWASGRPQ